MAKLWGGDHAAEPDKAFWELNRSFPFDRRLLFEEIAATRAWVNALRDCHCLGPDDASVLDAGLTRLAERAQADPSLLEIDVEDVHSFVETRLLEDVGERASQARLGRSRNEQAVTALRLWLRGAIDALSDGIGRLVNALALLGESAVDAVMPGYTHMRPAEPITFGHLAAAHAWALVRDRERLADARRRVNVLPLGSGALAGNALPIDRSAIASELGFEAVSENALDAVSDRDFAAEFAFACAQCQTHLARLAEDLIWLSSPELGLVSLPEPFTTGSSLMPQKKNPDALELIRGKAARADGDLLRLLALMKGLTTGYQKDLQEDKEAVFDLADTLAASLAVMAGVVSGLDLDREAMRRAASREEMMAAGLAVALSKEGMPFRQAHALVGALVAEAAQTRISLREVAARVLPAHSPAVAARLSSLFDPDEAVRAKSLPGGTAPDAVRASLAKARERVSQRR